MVRGAFARVAIALALALPLSVAAGASAPAARAACDGGFTYREAVGHAHGAVVGTITRINHDLIRTISQVKVQRAVGTNPGTYWHGRATVGLCGSDFPRLGARVVLLLDVKIGEPASSWNLTYTVGITVTDAEVARLVADLPDTATAGPAETAGSQPPPALPATLAAFVALLALFTLRPVIRRRGR